MSYMGAFGYFMSDCGLQDLWETVYAQKSIKHMLTGHAYARVLRAHIWFLLHLSFHICLMHQIT